MKNIKYLGRIEKLRPITGEQFIKLLEGRGYVGFVFGVTINDLMECHNTYEGLNLHVDTVLQTYCPAISGSLSDLSYCFVESEMAGEACISVSGSVAELELENF